MNEMAYFKKRLASYYHENGKPRVDQGEIWFIEDEILALIASGYDYNTTDHNTTDHNDWRDWSKAVYLNERFPGCHRHHITETIVVCIPPDLHKSVKHNLKTGKGMAKMNMLALQFMGVEL